MRTFFPVKKSMLILLMIIISVTAIVSISCGKPGLSGTYEGTLPCADCPGLKTILTINSDGTFHMEETYLDTTAAPVITDGNWSVDGGIITFTAGENKFEYKIISEKEIKWAPDGQEITGTDLNWSLLKK
jgi:hypothetical protein